MVVGVSLDGQTCGMIVIGAMSDVGVQILPGKRVLIRVRIGRPEALAFSKGVTHEVEHVRYEAGTEAAGPDEEM